MAGRVVKADEKTIVVRRNNSEDLTLPRARVIGKVVAQTRSRGANIGPPASS
jgi:hypothetical protein